jgi:hypothetical protein
VDATIELWLCVYSKMVSGRPVSYMLIICPPQLIPANRPGLSIAKWRISSQTDDLRLELFQEALVEWGLLEAIVLSLVLIRSGYCLGDTFDVLRDCFMSVPVAGLG